MITRIINWIKLKIARTWLEPCIRYPFHTYQEDMPNPITGDTRKVNVIALTCGHKFWQEEQVDLYKQAKAGVLCDRCILDYFVSRWGNVKGWERFKELWEGKLKVKV